MVQTTHIELKRIEDTAAFENVTKYLERSPKAPSYEVLKGLEGILNGINRGTISPEHQEKEFFSILLELYKSYFEIHSSFTETKDVPFLKESIVGDISF